MRMECERTEVIRYGRKLVEAGLTTGTGGNLSILNRELGLWAVTPSGMDYAVLEPEDIVLVDMNGQVAEGAYKPSSEAGFHLALYNHRPDITAVVHTHSVHATTLACLNWELPAVHYLVGFSGDKVPLADYALFGTQELADNIIRAIGDYNVVLMANHGLCAIGSTIAQAFAAAEEIELVSKIYLLSKSVGEPVILSKEQMDPVLEKFKVYGQKKS